MENMTKQIIPKLQTFETPAPRQTEGPQLDEGLWQAWLEKNEQRDKMKFARRMKVLTVLVVLLGVVALLRVDS
jgi:membrane protein required for beta-lactamase induction